MKISIPDSLFVRLFLLLFVILTLSYFAGREVFISLGLEHPVSATANQQHPFRLVSLFIRLTAVGITAWIAAIWLSKPIKRLALAADELGKELE